MCKKLGILFGLILSIASTGCSIETPEIRGVVLDAETKQPVEGAWITGMISVKAKTVAGDVTTYLSIAPPHTRTDKSGRFIIPSKQFDKPSFPRAFGADVMSFGIGASTVDDRGGDVDLLNVVGKDKVEITIFVKPEHEKDTEREHFSYLQGLYTYCLTGRFYVEVPPVEGGCDEWELDYAIVKHERYLKKFKNPKLIEDPPYGVSKFENIIHYSGIQRQLGNLLKKKGAYEKALNVFEQLKGFDEKHRLSMHLSEYEAELKELQQKIQEGKK